MHEATYKKQLCITSISNGRQTPKGFCSEFMLLTVVSLGVKLSGEVNLGLISMKNDQYYNFFFYFTLRRTDLFLVFT